MRLLHSDQQEYVYISTLFFQPKYIQHKTHNSHFLP